MSRARDFANLAGSADAGGITGKNLIINGAMQVAQRGTSATGVTPGTSYTTVDRFFFNTSATSLQTTQEQSTDAPDEFSNSFKITTTTVSSGTEYGIFEQRIEGQNLQHLNWSASNGKNLTASFYIKASQTGTMVFAAFTTAGGNRSFVKTFTYDTANTWQKVSITIPNDTGGSALTNDNNTQFRTWIVVDAGGAWGSGTQQDGWASYDAANIGVDVNTNILGTLNATVQITGVQLEVGSQATPFEHRSFADEMLRCQRYFCGLSSTGTTPVVEGGYIYGYTWENNNVAGSEYYSPVDMRAQPTLSYTASYPSTWTSTYYRINGVRKNKTSHTTGSWLNYPQLDAEL